MKEVTPATPYLASRPRRYSRRRVVVLAGAAGAAALAAACASPPPSQAPAPTGAPARTADKPVAAAPTAPAPIGTPTASGAAAPVPSTPGAAPTAAIASQSTGATAAKPSGSAPKRGGTVNAVVQNDWVKLDPIFETGSGGGFNMLFDTWVRWAKDPTSGIWSSTPNLIAEWDLKADAATFKLQKGIQFHDGTPWDAKAAKWNFDRMVFHPQSRYKGFFAGVDHTREDQAELEKLKDLNIQTFDFVSKAVEVVDEMTIRVKLARPLPAMLGTLASTPCSPVSPSAYQKLGKDAFARAPIGLGPYKFAEWKPGDRLVLEKNTSYWRMGVDEKPLPYVDKLSYRLVIDDSVRLLEVRSGNAHIMESVQGKDIAQVRSDPNLVFIDTDGQGISRRLTFDGKNPSSPFVKHPELRKAMLYGIDRATMAKTLGFDSGTPDKYIYQKSSFVYDETLPFYAYDKAKAQQMVKDVTTRDPSLLGPDGKIPITLTVISRAVDKTQAEMLKQMANDIGFNITIETLERAAYVAKIVQLPSKPGADYHISTVQNGISPDDPDLHPRSYFFSAGGQNYPHVDVFDGIIEKAAGTYDPAERKKLYREFMQMDYDLALMGYMWFQKYNWLHAKKLKNFTESAGGAWDLSKVWLD